MRHILAIITENPTAQVAELIATEQALTDHHLEQIDLRESPDYNQLLDEIFRADSIQVL